MAQITYQDLGLELKVGDKISFTNSVGFYDEMLITRIRNKSIYLNGNRNSYGTFKKLMKYSDFKLISDTLNYNGYDYNLLDNGYYITYLKDGTRLTTTNLLFLKKLINKDIKK